MSHAPVFQLWCYVWVSYPPARGECYNSILHRSGRTLARPAVITIDGPVAAGKTVVGRLLSQKLDYRFLDTGVMYRAITWLALVRGTSLDDEQALGRLAQETTISLQGRDSRVVLVDGRQLSPELREPQVDRAVSLVSRVPEVRVAMVRQQREIAKDGAIVVVGRDVGTVVLPGADLKLFFVASVSERARASSCGGSPPGRRCRLRPSPSGPGGPGQSGYKPL